MTIREYLYRRWRWPTYASMVVTVLFIATLVAGCSTRCMYFIIPLFITATGLSWLPWFTMRCPRCRVRLSGTGMTRGLFATRKSHRFGWCPGCGVDLESPA